MDVIIHDNIGKQVVTSAIEMCIASTTKVLSSGWRTAVFCKTRSDKVNGAFHSPVREVPAICREFRGIHI